KDDPGLEGLVDRVLVGRSSVLGDGLAHGEAPLAGSGWGVSHGGGVRPARDARTPARFRTGVRNCYRPLVGIVPKRRSPPRWCSNYNCRSLHITSFRSYRPYPMRRACASGWFVRREAPKRGTPTSYAAGRTTSDPSGSSPSTLRPASSTGSSPGFAGGSVTTTSGRIPLPWIHVLSGLSHFAIVRRKPPLSSSS